jgi:hypothetical protein
MSAGEIISAAEILAGSGAAGWLADKLLGPSAQALGEQIQVYASERIRRILGKASKKVDHSNIQAPPPGFTVIFFQRASLSEDDDTLTEMWANLLASAATSYSSRHAAYVEILSQLTAADALALSDLVPVDMLYHPQITAPVNYKIELLTNLARGIKNVSGTEAEANDELQRLLNLKLSWPGRVYSGRVYFKGKERNQVITGGRSDHLASLDNLVRLGLIERFDVSNSLTQYDVAVEGVLVTMFGIGFIQTSRGCPD